MSAGILLSSPILIAGSNAPGALEDSYFRALQKLGARNVELFNVDSLKYQMPRKWLAGRLMNRFLTPGANIAVRRQLYKRLSGNSYDAVIIFKGMEFSRASLESFRRLRPETIWININPDDPLNLGSRGSTNTDVLESLSFYDIYCTWSRRLNDRLKQRGCRNVVCLPFGYDADVHVSVWPAVQAKPGLVTFVGAWDKQREVQLTALADFDLRIYGESWNRLPRRSPLSGKVVLRNLYGPELARVMAESEISLNLLRSQNEGSHNMRTFEIPAMGGLMLTTRSHEQQEMFPESEACLMFSDADEMKLKIQWAISHPVAATAIRQRGMELVRRHSYFDRARNLLHVLGAS